MKFKNLEGMKFGRLTVLNRIRDHYYPNGRHDVQYKCKCDCGNTVNVLGIHLRSGHTTSCGCFRVDTSRKRMTTHGMTSTRLYIIWRNMLSRCYNKKNHAYKNYGGSKKWKHDFMKFVKWSLKHGYANNLTIDRIDNNDNYRPKNCRWCTYKEQSNNTRRNILLTYQGETHTMKEWCEILLLDYKLIQNRIKHGWSVIEAFETPVINKK